MVQKIEILKELNEKLKKIAPREAEISKVEIEGAEVIIYTKNPAAFYNSDNLISKIAFELKKRVNIRVDKKNLLGKFCIDSKIFF